MKLKVLAFALSGGILWGIWVFWCVLMQLVGVGSIPYNFVDQVYLGWLSPSIGGAILGLAIGFADGFVACAIFAWIYNKIAK